MAAANEWYTFLDATRNAANNLVNDVKQVEKCKENGGKNDGSEVPNGKKAKVKQVIHYVEKSVHYCLSTLSVLLLLLATVLLIWQLYGKIQSYIDNPVQVSTTYSYPNSMPFPGVTLCNTKPLRMSYVGPTPMMAVIDYLNLKNNHNLTLDEKFISNITEANKLNMTSFYLDAVQPKEDFILQCSWPDGTICSPDNIEKVITDYGICYKLKDSSLPNVTHSGSTSGLVIMLNIATYDNVKGREKTIGAKLAIYDKDSTPLVTHIGFDSPPGFQTDVGVESQVTNRLQTTDKGNCDSTIELKLFKKYTQQACRMEQSFLQVLQECQCKPFNMPDENLLQLSVPLCNAQQQFLCALPILHNPVKVKCSMCPESCQSKTYSMTLSYSQISVSNIEEFLKNSGHMVNISANYEKALDAISTYEMTTKESFGNKVYRMLMTFKDFHDAKFEPSFSTFSTLQEKLLKNVPMYKNEFLWKQNTVDSVADALNSKQPVILKNVLNALQEISTKYQLSFNITPILFPLMEQYQLEKAKLPDINYQINFSESVKDDSNFMATDKRAQEMQTQLLSKIHDLCNQYGLQSNQILTTSKTSLKNVTKFAASDLLVNNTDFVQTTNTAFNQLQVCFGASDKLSDVTVFLDNASFELSLIMKQISENEQNLLACFVNVESFLAAIDNYYKAYSANLLSYQLLLTNLDTYKMDQYQFYIKLNSDLIVTFTDNDYFDIQNLCVDYMMSTFDRAEFSKQITFYSDYWISLQDHFGRIRSQLLNARINVDNFLKRVEDFSNSLDQTLLNLANKELLGSLNSTVLTHQCLNDIKTFFSTQLKLLSDLSNTWRQNFDALISDCATYQASFVIGESFFSTNIVIYNVYYKELTITKFTQFLTYSSMGMFSDIAGVIGIILGFLGTTAVALYTSLKDIYKTAKEKIKGKSSAEHIDEDSTATSGQTVVVSIQHDQEEHPLERIHKQENSSNKQAA